MTDTAGTPRPSRSAVGVALGDYLHLEPLPRAVSDVDALGERFEATGFATTRIIDEPRDRLVQRLYDALPEDGLAGPGTVLVVLWAGHAEQNLDTGSLRLLARANRPGDPDALTVTADEVAELAARTGAGQLLLLFDSCFSGSGVVDAARVVDAIRRKLVDREHRWVGIVASCQDYERARDGALARKLIELLEHGPRDPILRMRWSSYQAGLRGDDLVDALVKEWEEERQVPKPISLGDPWLILPNPLYRANAPEQVVEHLLWASRGAAQNEAGVWFTGRVEPMRQIVSWLGRGQAGLCVVTGPAGCGKSAVAGRIVALSDPVEREEVVSAQGPPPAALDPGRHSVAAHVQVRGLTLDRCAEVLGRALGATGAQQVPNHHDVLAWASREAVPPVVVVDGLDEAGPEAFEIARDLLSPLARYARVIVASREVPALGVAPSLLESLGPATIEVDLEADPEATDRDVHAYVVARLTRAGDEPVDEAMDSAAVATEVVRLSRARDHTSEGPFLLARIITSQLIAAPLDTSQPTWRARLAGSVVEAFEQDLQRGRPLERDGQRLEHAPRELLTALAYSFGSGFPDDVWAAVASSLSPSATAYGRLDVFWALGQFGRYVTASSLAGQAVYRLHQRLADALRDEDAPPTVSPVERGARAVVARTLLERYDGLLQNGAHAVDHPYLWYYAWRHAVDLEDEGIAALEGLAERDATLAPDVASALTTLGLRLSAAGRHTEAVGPTERAVALYERLAAQDSRFLRDLAGALNNLGNGYGRVGRQIEALAPSKRAVALWERLVEDDPSALNDLAGALNNLGIRYAEIGRHVDSIEPTERSVELWEQLSRDNPAFLNEYAGSLNNLANRYGQIGRYRDAVLIAERSVAIREQVAEDDASVLHDVASSLHNLGTHYSEIGRRADAVRQTERAVEIHERLAADNPAFLGELAGSLNNLGNRYGEVGRHAEAAALTERSVAIREQLAAENRGFLADLATALNNLGIHYGKLGRDAEAIAPTRRAVEISEELAEENPRYREALASALGSLGLRCRAVGQAAEALAATQRAVEIYGELAEANHAFRRELASALSNLGVRLAETGRRAESVEQTERAVRMFEELPDEGPTARAGLAGALTNLGVRYAQVGDHGAAAEPTARAVAIYEDLVADNPGFKGELAGALNNLGNRYAAVGQLAEAVAAIERTIEIRTPLAEENPTFLGELAGSWSNLGALYAQLGRGHEGEAAQNRSIEMLERLARGNEVFKARLAGSLNNLGSLRANTGEGDAIEPFERALAIYLETAGGAGKSVLNVATCANNLAQVYRERGDEASATRVWEAVLARFEGDPSAEALLHLRRARSPAEYELAIDDLVEACRLDPGDETGLTATIRRGCRAHRVNDPERFDAAWRARTGGVPAWLRVTPESVELCVAWLNLASWRESRDFAARHADRLLSDAGVTALEEIELDHPNDARVKFHRHLLEAARARGIEAAFALPLLAETVGEWRSAESLGEAKQYLLRHRDELVSADAVELLGRSDDTEGEAIAVLARAEEIDLAYEVLENPQSHRDALAKARAELGPREIAAVAALCGSASDDPLTAARAVGHEAIALAVAGETGAAQDRIRGVCGSPHAAAVIADLTDAITRRSEHAGPIAVLIRVLAEGPAQGDAAADGAET